VKAAQRASLTWSTRAILWLYELLWLLVLPLVLLRLYLKGRLQAGYRENILERLGVCKKTLTGSVVWVHAVSVGETRACAPLVHALLQDGYQVVLTHMTPTGRATGADIFSNEITAGRLQQVYLPYDISYFVGAFLKAFTPQLCLIMETEVWPCLVIKSSQAGLPLLLVNARLSKRSARRVARWGQIGLGIYGSFTQILAQTSLDAKRYESLGLSNVTITGNLKFDVQSRPAQIDQALELRKLLNPDMRILCAASTRDGEEKLILQAWKELLVKHPELVHVARLLVVPRHPQRFQDVYQDIASQALKVSKKSQLSSEQLAQALTEGQIILGDTMGEMAFYYALSDAVVMGGSLLPLGGQNFIEACALGRPIILGEHTFNFQQASHDAVEQEAAIRIRDISELTHVMAVLLSNHDLREKMSANAIDFAGQHAGATQKILAVIRRYM
jgi:3-deoxy-D-manno-octulosonic-acid transferase